MQLQGHQQVTYQSLLSHCKLIKARCKQFQKAQVKGQAKLTNLTAASSTTSSVQQYAITTHTNTKCSWCGYTHPTLAALPSARNTTTAMAMVTSLPCARSHESPGAPRIGTQIAEPGLKGQAATDAPADQQAEASSPTKAVSWEFVFLLYCYTVK